MTNAESMVIQAAKDWMLDRDPRDPSEKALFVAIARAWPEELACREDCTCGEADTCDECPTRAQTEAAIASLERDLAARRDGYR